MDIQKILHTKSSLPKRKRRSFEKGVLHPVREWLVGLLFFLAVLSIGGAISTYTFLRYTDIVVTESTTNQTHTPYNQILVQKALKIYQSRKDDFEAQKDKEIIKVPVILEVASSTPVVPEENNETIAPTGTPQSDIGVGETQLAN